MGRWKDLVESTLPVDERHEDEEFTYGPPAADAELRKLEAFIKGSIPSQLKSLLSECNGVENPIGSWVVFPIEQMIEENQTVRADYADWKQNPPLEKVLMFSDVLGIGDLYGVCLSAFNGIKPGEIVHFDHETAQLQHEADDLEDFFKNWP